jgi:CRP-like cAMP-binding protein
MSITRELEANSAQPNPRQLLEELYQSRVLHPYKSGTLIPLKAEDVWIVCRGVVQLSTLYPSGDEALLGFAGPSTPFGLPFTMIHPYQATALSDVDLMMIPMDEVERSPALLQTVSHHLIQRLRQTEAMLALVGHRRIEDRLRQLLLLLTQEFGQTDVDGVRLNLRLTHQHLANAIGTTRVTVTRLLGQFRKEGWLKMDMGRHIVIPNQALL